MSSKRTNTKAQTKTQDKVRDGIRDQVLTEKDDELWDADTTAQFFKDLGLQAFHQQRSQTDPDAYLRPYLALKELEGYQVLKRDRSVLRPFKTFIRYVPIIEANTNKHYSEHLRCGGILISGGYFEGRKYIESDDPSEWTALRLKFKAKVLRDKKGRIIDHDPAVRIYNIKLNRCHVFYRRFGLDIVGDVMGLLDDYNIDVELV